MSLGKYIAFEGLEGCGKSTHVKRLATRLNAVMTREPGGTVVGSMLRNILIDPANTNLSPRAEALMMAADRAHHIAELVSPSLQAGRHVVSDRSVFSSLAYQGYGRQQDI
ncbi:MAG: dTMP kinase, partial [Acidimicrobiaceae bacterium]